MAGKEGRSRGSFLSRPGFQNASDGRGVSATMKKDAKLSACRRYRFALWRAWDESGPVAMFIGLNPSKANEREDDPTLVRCINFAKSWGYGGVCIANLFAYRATDPNDMRVAERPVGRGNDRWLQRLSAESDIVIAAWGNDGAYMGRGKKVRSLIPDLYCLQLNKSGEPAHPLYLKRTLLPVPMHGR